jgi:hypothetical protein
MAWLISLSGIEPEIVRHPASACERGHVADDFRCAGDTPACVPDRSDGDRTIDEPALLRPANRFEMIDAFTAPQLVQDDVLVAHPVVRGQPVNRRSHDLVGAKTEDILRPVIPAGHDPVQVVADNRVGG